VNVRPLVDPDLDAVAAFVAADEERLFGRPSRIGLADVQAWLAGVDLEHDSHLVEETGEIAAVGWVEPQTGGFGVPAGLVGQDCQGRGLGGALVEWAEARLVETGRTRIHQVALAADVRAPALFAACGYREVRRFWEMAIELDGPPPVPVVPDGMRLESFAETDARLFHHALDEAFEDHWEHHTRPFDEWWEEKRGAPGYDPTLWFAVHDGDELAAVVRNDPNRNGGGWIGALGVRRSWRGRGLGRALLLHSFGDFHRRGVTRVGLGVDAENPTGATKLYESVGMHVELEHVVYEKELR